MERKTLARTASLQGLGVWTGAGIEVICRPAGPGQGIAFVRDGQRIPATVQHVVDAPNCTGLRAGKAEVFTVEHFLSAAAALGITDMTVECSGPELPLLDGSAMPFLDLFESAGLSGLGVVCEPIVLAEPVCVENDCARITATPASAARLGYWLNHPHPLVGRQYACFWPDRMAYREELASARTFVTEEEANALIAEGWLKSGGEDNAVVVYRDGLSADPTLPQAFARHKLVDLLGDLWLLGRPLIAEVTGWRSGHRENAELARRIWARTAG